MQAPIHRRRMLPANDRYFEESGSKFLVDSGVVTA